MHPQLVAVSSSCLPSVVQSADLRMQESGQITELFQTISGVNLCRELLRCAGPRYDIDVAFMVMNQMVPSVLVVAVSLVRKRIT